MTLIVLEFLKPLTVYYIEWYAQIKRREVAPPKI